jgi:hypothetical protein
MLAWYEMVAIVVGGIVGVGLMAMAVRGAIRMYQKKRP